MLAGRGVDRGSRPRLLCGADEARQATQAPGEKCFHQPLFYPGSRLARASQMVARVNFLECARCGLAVGEGNRGSFEDFAGFGSLTTADAKPEGPARCQAAIKDAKQLEIGRASGRER